MKGLAIYTKNNSWATFMHDGAETQEIVEALAEHDLQEMRLSRMFVHTVVKILFFVYIANTLRNKRLLTPRSYQIKKVSLPPQTDFRNTSSLFTIYSDQTSGNYFSVTLAPSASNFVQEAILPPP